MTTERVVPATMTETLSAHEAARVFADATRWENSLAQRTEGLTWMIWAATTPALIITMGFVGSLDLPAWAQLLSWPPWVLLGYIMTHTLWRTTSISRPTLAPPGFLSYILKSLVIVGLVVVLHYLLQPATMVWPLLLIGAGWVGIGILSRRLTGQGRRAAVGAGAAILVGTAGLSLAAMPDMLGMLFAAGVTGVAALGAGLFQTLSG